MNRHLFNCRSCRTTWRIDTDARVSAVDWFHLNNTPQRCSCSALVRGKLVVGHFNAEKACNAKCMGATSGACECQCAGSNHGASH